MDRYDKMVLQFRDVLAETERLAPDELQSYHADRAYIINNGHIVYEGPAQEIKARPEVLHRHLGV